MNEHTTAALAIMKEAGIKAGPAMSMMETLGARCICTARQGQAPAFVIGIMPLEMVEQGLAKGMEATAIYVSPETHARLAERAGVKTQHN